MPRAPKYTSTKIKVKFLRAGFEFHQEFMNALEQVDAKTKLEALVAIAPYFLEKMGQVKKPDPKTVKTFNPNESRILESVLVDDDTASELSRLLESNVKRK